MRDGEVFPEDADSLLFGFDWEEEMNEHFATMRAAGEAMLDIAANNTIGDEERERRLSDAQDVRAEAFSAGLTASMILLTARARLNRLFDIHN